jgi:hypothetical protein
MTSVSGQRPMMTALDRTVALSGSAPLALVWWRRLRVVTRLTGRLPPKALAMTSF